MFRGFGSPFFSDSPTLFDSQPSGYYSNSPYESYRDPFSPFVDLRQPAPAQQRKQPRHTPTNSPYYPHNHSQRQQHPHPHPQHQHELPTSSRYFGMHPRDVELLKAREAAELKQVQEREAKLKAKQKALEEKKKLLARWQKAATTIQRFWRSYRTAKLNLKKAEAIEVIKRVIKAYPAIKDAKLIAKAFKQLKTKEDKLGEYDNQFSSKKFTYRELLGIQDEIERLVISLDQVESYGKEAVRNRRKEIVQEANAVLKRVDAQLLLMRQSASKIQKWVRQWEQRRKEQKQNEAAKTITHTLRNYPAVKRAKLELEDLKKTRMIQQKLLKAQQEFTDLLTNLKADLSTESTNDFVNDFRKELLNKIDVNLKNFL